MRFLGFNGQERRIEAFNAVRERSAFEIICETGSSCGHTSAWLAELTGLPVVTMEVQEVPWRESQKNTVGLDVRCLLGDSRTFLSALLDGHPRTFFYLDAHWGPELPLAEEIDIIASRWADFVILIDDFKVPEDDGYRFDDYGCESVIALPLISPVLAKHTLTPYFPVAPSNTETGAVRGSCWIASHSMEPILSALPTHLRK
jgi:hypothetical protein